MEIKIVSDTNEPLLSKRLVVAAIEWAEGPTPTRIEVRKKVADALRLSEDQLVLTKIGVQFGFRKASVAAQVYASKELLQKLAPKHLKARLQPKPKGEGEAAEPQKKPAEKKAEAKKAEPKKAEPKKAE